MAESLPGDRANNVIAASVSTTIIAVVVVAMRAWARVVFRKTGFWWDDWTVVAAVPFIIGSFALTLYWVHIGFGKHLKRVVAGGTDMETILAVLLADGFLYSTAITFVKLSALLFYNRVFRNVVWFRWTLWATATLVLAWWLAFVLVAIFTCIPVEKQWDTKVPGHCVSPASTYIGTATPNVLIDLIILLLPMPVLWRLQSSGRRKLALTAVFTLGYCVMIISIVRLVTTVKFDQSAGMEDLTWDFVPVHILVVVEPPLAVVSVCLPSIFQLMKRGFEHGFTSLFTTKDPSEDVQTVYATRTVRGGNTLDREHQGFVKLTTGGTGNSVDRLVQNKSSAIGDPAALTAGSDVPLKQIHVRRDINVDHDTVGREF